MDSEETARIDWLDHDADILMEGFAPGLESLFRHCALELVRTVCGPVGRSERTERSVHLTGIDRGDLLVAWLNEILFLISSQRFVPVEIGDLLLEEGKLTADLIGSTPPPGDMVIVREIKAATYHELRVVRKERGWQARILFDV